jgi:hypothetical protein
MLLTIALCFVVVFEFVYFSYVIGKLKTVSAAESKSEPKPEPKPESGSRGVFSILYGNK